MTVVVGTAGHIDHGKTTLLRALTGIDADRLPEEQRRGMTIDVGYAYLRFDDGSEVDFVDVPGHDRLIGNMLVGAGEIDAALLVVAADDGPRAQTLEHLGLLDALGIDAGFAVVTKTDAAPPGRTSEVIAAVRGLLDATSLAGAAVIAISSLTGDGLPEVWATLADLCATVADRRTGQVGPPRLGIDRVFRVRGRGVVVTGSLRGGALARGDIARIEPDGAEARIRELQVHNRAIDRAEGGGRVALNLVGTAATALRRGSVLTIGPGVERTDRLLVGLGVRRALDLRHGMSIRVHLGTDEVDGTLDLGRRASAATLDGRVTAILRLERPIAAAFGDALVIRRPSPAATLAGATVLDPLPPRGVSRRRATFERLREVLLADAGSIGQLAALVRLHGALPVERVEAWRAVTGSAGQPVAVVSAGSSLIAEDIDEAITDAAISGVEKAGGLASAELRAGLIPELRRRVTVDRPPGAAIVGDIVNRLVAAGRLGRSGEQVVPAGRAVGPSVEVRAAMDRLEAMLRVPTPPSLSEAAAAAGCPRDGIRALEAAGRIVRIEDDLAWAAPTFAEYVALATRLARAGPVTPAAFRDAIGSSRRYALAILEDLDRRGVLRRTPDGHVPGPGSAAPAVPVR